MKHINEKHAVIALALVAVMVMIVGVSFPKVKAMGTETVINTPIVDERSEKQISADEWVYNSEREQEEKDIYDDMVIATETQRTKVLKMQKATSESLLKMVAQSGYASSTVEK